MTEREKLVKLLRADIKNECDKHEKCVGCPYENDREACYNHLATATADYLLENGVIVPPCKVGDIIYVKYSGTIEYFVISKVIHNGSNSFDFEADLENEDGYAIASIEFGSVEIGRTVFLTKEEAEEKLKELSK